VELEEDEDELKEEEREDQSERKVELGMDRLGREVELMLEVDMDGSRREEVLMLPARDGATRNAGRGVF
jgi:hypothetical protein